MRARTQSLLALAFFLLASRAMSQGPAASFQAGVTPLEYASAFELGVRFSPRGPVGIDVSIDVYPEYLTLGALASVADFSFAGNVPLGSVARVELRAGPSVLGIVAPGGALAAPGYNAGVGVVLTIDARTAVRADYTYRRLQLGEESYAVPSLTAGFVIHR
jgi:hypothetical protein